MSTITPAGFNYAKSFGIETVAPAIVFAVLYGIFFAIHLKHAIARPKYINIILTLFCAVRITAFSLRAALANIPKDGQNLQLFTAYEVIYNIGFFGILYSVYNLVIERMKFSNVTAGGIISKAIRMHFAFRLCLSAAVAVGITGAVESTSTQTSTRATGNTLREVAIYIFLALSILVLYQVVVLIWAESKDRGYKTTNESFGSVYGVWILALISILLVLREAFFAGTSKDTTKQNKETIWYPLAALPEILVVALFLVPGLIPTSSKSEGLVRGEEV